MVSLIRQFPPFPVAWIGTMLPRFCKSLIVSPALDLMALAITLSGVSRVPITVVEVSASVGIIIGVTPIPMPRRTVKFHPFCSGETK